MRPDRRALLLALPALAVTKAHAAQDAVLRVNGTVSQANYKGLEAFLFNSLDTVVGLKLAFEANENAAEGSVEASASDKQFVSYLRGDGQSEIVANEGWALTRGAYLFDGFFVVKNGGMNQGITSLFLDPADEASVLPSNKPVRDIDVNRLRAEIRN